MAQTEPNSGLTWNRLFIFCLVIMLLGPVVGSAVINNLGYFAPPLLNGTVYIYLLLWLPVFVVGLLLRPVGSKRALPLFVVLGIVLIVFGLILLGPAFNYMGGDCILEQLPDQTIRYTCLSPPNYQGAQIEYVLQGQAGSPFVQVSSP